MRQWVRWLPKRRWAGAVKEGCVRASGGGGVGGGIWGVSVAAEGGDGWEDMKEEGNEEDG